MSYDYEHSVPFKYNKYRTGKEYVLTDEIKSYFNDFFKYIKALDEGDILSTDENSHIDKIDALVQVLSNKYRELREKYIKPCIEEKYNYKMSIFVSDEVDFIFACSYLLIKKFGLSQAKLAQIFGMRANTFSKIGCFPYRAYNAYTKLDDVSARKCLIPNDSNSIGIQIAACINKKVQTYYLCSGFVGVSNDLDLFANISSTDLKRFILTHPANADNPIESMLCYTRFLLASSNNFDGIIGNYHAGDVKDKINDLLNLKDNEGLDKKENNTEKPNTEKTSENRLLKYSSYLKDLLSEGDEYREYCKNASSTIFVSLLRKYRGQLALIQLIDDDEYDPDDLIYDSKYRKEIGLEKVNFDLYDVDSLYKYLLKSSDEICNKLLESMTYSEHGRFDEKKFADYLNCMHLMLMEKSKLNSKGTSIFEEKFSEEEKILLAAIYWVIEACKNEPMTEQKHDNILKYLKSKNLLNYFDALNKEVKKGKQSHLFYEREDFDINDVLCGIESSYDSSSPPILIYIDSDCYKLEMGYVSSLLKEKDIVLVVRDTKGFTDEWGMELLDKELSLYIKERQYANISEMLR